jgi:oxepin-CoA hydrolase/3-oxo-5,6-dehydrosuberyl-CoA semialdehyde dehydrogenase
MQPVFPGDVMKVQLTCKSKKGRPGQEYGEVRWDVTITNQDGDVCANYELLTLNALASAAAAE